VKTESGRSQALRHRRERRTAQAALEKSQQAVRCGRQEKSDLGCKTRSAIRLSGRTPNRQLKQQFLTIANSSRAGDRQDLFIWEEHLGAHEETRHWKQQNLAGTEALVVQAPVGNRRRVSQQTNKSARSPSWTGDRQKSG
jgi:hypothetical protein